MRRKRKTLRSPRPGRMWYVSEVGLLKPIHQSSTFQTTTTPPPPPPANSEDGKPVCGSCYGAAVNETHCCNSCQDVIDAYREKRWNPVPESFEQCKRENYVSKDVAKALPMTEGCQIYGHMEVNRVSQDLVGGNLDRI